MNNLNFEQDTYSSTLLPRIDGQDKAEYYRETELQVATKIIDVFPPDYTLAIGGYGFESTDSKFVDYYHNDSTGTNMRPDSKSFYNSQKDVTLEVTLHAAVEKNVESPPHAMISTELSNNLPFLYDDDEVTLYYHVSIIRGKVDHNTGTSDDDRINGFVVSWSNSLENPEQEPEVTVGGPGSRAEYGALASWSRLIDGATEELQTSAQ